VLLPTLVVGGGNVAELGLVGIVVVELEKTPPRLLSEKKLVVVAPLLASSSSCLTRCTVHPRVGCSCPASVLLSVHSSSSTTHSREKGASVVPNFMASNPSLAVAALEKPTAATIIIILVWVVRPSCLCHTRLYAQGVWLLPPFPRTSLSTLPTGRVQ